MRTICYYHGDADGILSGALVNFFVKGEKIFIEADYGMIIDWDHIRPDDEIYIVDFSFNPYDMEKLCLVANKVVWIDHHVSAINAWDKHFKIMREKYPEYKGIDGIRIVGVAGCQLTEAYFNEGDSKLVAAIGVYDTWNKDNKMVDFDTARKCSLGFIGNGYHPESEDLRLYFSFAYTGEICKDIADKSLVEKLIYEGGIIEKYLTNFQNEKMKDNAFEARVFGYRTLVLNTPLRGSAPLMERYEREDFDMMCVFFFDGNFWKYSFYTEKQGVDCSVVARGLAKDDTKIGGGHRGAAGCSLTWNLFDNQLKRALELKKSVER